MRCRIPDCALEYQKPPKAENKPRRVSPPQRRKALELFLGRLCRPQKHISDRKCARRARAAGCNLVGRKRPAGLFWPEKNAPDFFKSGAWNVAHAVPPWFSRRSPERPSKPPTRPRPLTRPTVPPYFSVQADCSGTSYPQGGRTPVCTNHRLSEGGVPCLFSRRCI